MYELKIAAPEFLLAALEAGSRAHYEGAILILTRGLSPFHQEELIKLWSDLDDITHNEILVLTYGISKEYDFIASGIKNDISTYDMSCHVIAEEVSVAPPSLESFSKGFGQLMEFAQYVPQIRNSQHEMMIDTHGTTNIRRVLGLAEQQLPALYVVSYRQRREYIVELGSDRAQLSPVRFISALAENLDDIPYKYRGLQKKATELSRQHSKLQTEIVGKQINLKDPEKFLARGQLESLIYHMKQTLIDAPNDLSDMGKKVIAFLRGEDEELERIKHYESSLVKYALSQNESAIAHRLPKKLRKAIDSRLRNDPFDEDRSNKRRKLKLEISELEEQQKALSAEQTSLLYQSTALNIETVFTLSVESTLKYFTLELKSQDSQKSVRAPSLFSSFPRMTYSLSSSTFSTKDEPGRGNKVFIGSSHKEVVSEQEASQPIELFYSYAHADERLRKHLETHLSALRQQGVITEWHDRKIVAGTDWKQSIDTHLMTAKVILLLISPDFLASDYCYSVEMQRALARHARGDAYVIPVILRPVDWQGTPFAHLQCMPTDAKPVTMWANRDEAFRDVATAIRAAIEQLQPHPSQSLATQQTTFAPAQIPAPASPPNTLSDYHSCVLSYAAEDQAFAEKLHADLQSSGVSCWFASHDLKIGDKLRTQIYEAIQGKDKLLLILSDHAVTSDWVEREVELVFERERQPPRTLVLFPIRLDDAVMQTRTAWAGDIRRIRFIGDFCQWRDAAAYQQALQRLLRDLHA
ncbi:MAG TPA: toll/interleukin-1 receptor domain-containing protein [Ktedonobacteraceae bacterium]|nr:toll/interleukin-1 receptor domain-containing protein [Ktedonobacteraceae bacterium]